MTSDPERLVVFSLPARLLEALDSYADEIGLSGVDAAARQIVGDLMSGRLMLQGARA